VGATSKATCLACQRTNKGVRPTPAGSSVCGQ
jgi:hypothetical protein